MLKRISVLVLLLVLVLPGFSRAEDTVSGRLIWRVRIHPRARASRARLWLPYPPTTPVQRVTDLRLRGNYRRHGFYTDPRGNLILYFEWDLTRTRRPELEVSYGVLRREVVRRDPPPALPAYDPAVFGPYLSANRYLTLNERVRALAERITAGRKTVPEKARAIYDWIVENMRRDPRVKGCGRGIVCEVLRRRCGKCADLNSVFVALSRAAGIPAREVFGLRLGRKPGETLTGAQHCWAEFFVPSYGWVPADPADVLKAALVKGLPPTAPELKSLREYYFGAVDAYRLAFTHGRDLILNPPQEGPPINYFVYPYLEIDGRPVDPFLGRELDFEIRWEKPRS